MSAAPVVLGGPPEDVVIAAGLIEATSRDEGEVPCPADAVVAIGSVADLMTARQRGREHAEIGRQHAAHEIEQPRQPPEQACRVGPGVPRGPREREQRDERAGPSHSSMVP